MHRELRNFIDTDDTIVIDVDFMQNQISFQSQEKESKSVNVTLKEDWIALRLMIEFGTWTEGIIKLV